MKDFGIIKDNVYEKPLGPLLKRTTVRALLIKETNGTLEIGLLKILENDIFGHRNHLETPGGGIEIGETAEIALSREVLEETGYKIYHKVFFGEIITEYNILKRLDYAKIFVAYVKEHIKQGEYDLKWFPLESILNVYETYEVQNVGQIIHQRDYLLIKQLMHAPLIRKGTVNDLDQIMVIINDAKRRLKLSGSPQWQKGYPNEETFLNDIKQGELYVLTQNLQIVGTMTLANYEPTYEKIIDGKWLNNDNYLVIHRIAIHQSFLKHGYASELISFAKSLAILRHIDSIRVDTHHNNLSMQKLVLKQGFQYCGIIHLNQIDDKERLAYELLTF